MKGNGYGRWIPYQKSSALYGNVISIASQIDQKVFKHDEPNFRLARETHNLATNFFYCAGRAGQRAGKVLVSVRWNKLELNWYKLNTDGFSVGKPGRAGGGGLI